MTFPTGFAIAITATSATLAVYAFLKWRIVDALLAAGIALMAASHFVPWLLWLGLLLVAGAGALWFLAYLAADDRDRGN